MIAYEQIKDVHLEISTLCNASCPWCPRNFWGYPYNGGYPECNLSLAQSKKIFDLDFLLQLHSIRINGNFGDIVMNPEALDIIKYFRKSNPNLRIFVSTNGGARNKDFWTGLAEQKVTVSFALDGLADTHHLYRQNTVFDRVLENAKTFITAGGEAIWKMIKFDHNVHQIAQCQQLSEQLGFAKFDLVNSTRNTAPVFDKSGTLTHVLGNYQGEKEFEILFHKKRTDQVLLEDIAKDRKPCNQINCETVALKSIYIAANGEVSPCCYTGFYPKTYGHGQYYQAVNSQLNPLIFKNNALEYPLKTCIEWFAEVKNSWNKPSFESGQLLICNDVCGQKQ